MTVKLNEGIRVTTVRLCPLCGKEGIKLYHNLRDRIFNAPGIWDVCQCSECGIVWLNPRPLEEDIGKLYVSYYTHYVGELSSPKMTLKKHIKRYMKNAVLAASFGYHELESGKVQRALGIILSRVRPIWEIIGRTVMYLPKATHSDRLLEIGCGNGRFLASFRELGWEVVGLEPDPDAARIAREKFGIEVYQETLEKAELPEASFDAVIMWHVIEHIPDLLEHFESVTKC